MESGSTQEVLRRAIEQLSQPFEAQEDVKVVSMKLDAIAANLLRSSYVTQKIGPDRTSELLASSPELSSVLFEIGGEAFVTAAACANDLLAISKSSLMDFGAAEEEVMEANATREKLHDAFTNLLTAVDG